MRYGVFGDIHGNLEAFQKVISSYKREAIDRLICVGDIVGYGANPRECIEEIKKIHALSICGNHDQASIGLLNIGYFNYAAKAAIGWTRGVLEKEDIEYLRSLKLILEEPGFSVVHGSLDRPGSFMYILGKYSSYSSFYKMEKELLFVGHSHVPGMFCMKDGLADNIPGCSVKIEKGTKYIINVGSVGQPRDKDPRASYCIYDTDKKTIEIKRTPYDVKTAKSKVLKKGLPKILGNRLERGL
ncbi:MAG: metallophosphoesterase family protein [Candidatus Omnitrophota bacterium]